MGGDDNHPPVARQDTPDLAHQLPAVFRLFQAVNDQQAVDRGIRQRPMMLGDENGAIGLFYRPVDNPLRGGRQRDGALSLRKVIQKWLGKTETGDPQA